MEEADVGMSDSRIPQLVIAKGAVNMRDAQSYNDPRVVTVAQNLVDSPLHKHLSLRIKW